MLNRVFIDFEFFDTKEKDLQVVCAAWLCPKGTQRKLFLRSKILRDKFKEYILYLPKEDLTFYSFNAVSEARCFINLGIDPLQFNWVDLMTEWKMCLNHSSKMLNGQQYAKGKVFKNKPNSSDFQASSLSGLVSCAFKLLGKKIDTEHKTAMRDLILTGDWDLIEKSKEAVLDYCLSDVVFLPDIAAEIVKFYVGAGLSKKDLRKEILLRGEYSARTALMEQIGYPVNLDWMKKLGAKIPNIMSDIKEDFNAQFPDTKLFIKTKKGEWEFKQKILREWIEKNEDMKFWPKTDKGAVKVDMKTIEKRWGKFNYTYPRDNFRAQYIRHSKAQTDLKSFSPKVTDGDKSIYTALGADNRVRSWFNPYGAQTGRSQPPSTTYIMLKSSWLRSIIQPNPGRAICGIDYSSQEFLLAGMISHDPAMIKAYESGDVYRAFGKAIGLIPKDAGKDEYIRERNLCKSAVLGMSYGMGYRALAQKIRDDTGDKTVTDEDGQKIIEKFDSTYADFTAWKTENIENYEYQKYLKAPCGWTIFDNRDPYQDFRSLNNFPIQASGASIMRKAVALAQDAGCNVILTLHDSLYIEIDEKDLHKIDTLNKAMLEAVIFYFKRYGHLMRTEAVLWGPGISKGKIITLEGLHVDTETIHVERKGEQQWNEYKHIFNCTN